MTATAPAPRPRETSPVEVHPRGLLHAGRYVRHMPVTLERMFENALDWEHLPWLHASTFASIRKTDGGDDFWRAEVEFRGSSHDAPTTPGEVELRLDTDLGRWITTTRTNPKRPASEVWTRAIEAADGRGIRVIVDFYVPFSRAAAADPNAKHQLDAIGRALCSTYERLYDEDEAMMRERQQALGELRGRRGKASVKGRLALGAAAALELPLEVAFAGRRWRVIEQDGALAAHAALCPHWLGPLDQPPDADGAVACPWHGYRFDLRSGREVSGRSCRLPIAPEIAIDDEGTVWLRDRATAPR